MSIEPDIARRGPRRIFPLLFLILADCGASVLPENRKKLSDRFTISVEYPLERPFFGLVIATS
jgi:hypothetical protein